MAVKKLITFPDEILRKKSQLIEKVSSEEKKEPIKTDILYLRYDDANMKFVYICTHCNTVWKSADDV